MMLFDPHLLIWFAALAAGALMALVVPNVGEDKFLQNITNKTAPNDLTLRIYTSNTTPAETDTAATYTEAAGGGYAAVALTAANWGTVSQGNPSTIAYPAVTYTFNGAATLNCYGYFVTGTADGVLRWAERFTNPPFVMQTNGDQTIITPQITLE
jgi:hypothetical protein